MALEDFLQSFKTSPKSELAGALGDMNIDEDDFSDEYDFMDDEDGEGHNTRRQVRTQAKTPKLKYMDVLQKVADRYEDEITIDLDDLAKVVCQVHEGRKRANTFMIVRPSIERKWYTDEFGYIY